MMTGETVKGTSFIAYYKDSSAIVIAKAHGIAKPYILVLVPSHNSGILFLDHFSELPRERISFAVPL
jgi:hypothetical protein